MILAVEDVDLWKLRAMTDRTHAWLFDGFEKLLAMRTGVVCILTTAREHSLGSSVTTRIPSVWRGTDRIGVFRISNHVGPPESEVQVFWEPLVSEWVSLLDTELESTLQCLPPTLETVPTSPAFALQAETGEEFALRPGERWTILVIGQRGSGRTTALHALARSWQAAHPSGTVENSSSSQAMRNELSNPSAGRPRLIMIDDLEHSDTTPHTLSDLVADSQRGVDVSVIVAVSPTFVRAHPDHWIQHLRRERTGVLLDRSAIDDADLFGIHTALDHVSTVFSLRPGRGLWVEGGSPKGIVQFFVGPQARPDHDVSCPAANGRREK